jgi:SAM-dependent methyltransferase
MQREQGPTPFQRDGALPHNRHTMPVPAAVRQPDPPGVGWFATPLAQRLLREEQRQVLPLLAGCYGQVGLYLRGCESGPAELSGNMLQSVVRLSGAHGVLRGDLCCRAAELPLQRESVDLFYLLHVFEARTPPAALLAEAERTLTPEGALLMVALNPLSPWRARWAPAGLRTVSAAASRDWLRDAGFEVLQQRGVGPVLPWLDAAAQRARGGHDAFSGLRAGYALLARKRRAGLTPLRSRVPLPIGAGVPTA